jgi:Fuc2NAc and GlcNAc transferase
MEWNGPAGIAAAGLATAFASLLLVRLVLAYAARRGVVEEPGTRHSHTVTTATGGGLGMVAALCLASLWLYANAALPTEWAAAVVPGVAILALVGWVDDMRRLSPLLRVFVQLAVSFGLLGLLRSSGQLDGWPVLLTVGLALVWIMNMYNFMDGSHGMAGFQGLFAGLVTGVVFLQGAHDGLGLAALLVAAVCLGFLPWNFPAPRVFMGDAGSVPLGFALGALLCLGVVRGLISLPVGLMVLSVFLVDSTLTLLKRVIEGERWYTAHRKHVYQRLIAQGWPHSRVLLLYQAINIIVVTPAIVLAMMYPEHAWPIAGLLTLLLTAGWYAASLRLEVRT